MLQSALRNERVDVVIMTKALFYDYAYIMHGLYTTCMLLYTYTDYIRLCTHTGGHCIYCVRGLATGLAQVIVWAKEIGGNVFLEKIA
jgi:hypothetical protein